MRAAALAVGMVMASGTAAADPPGAGDPAAGQALFRACAVCHTLTPDGGRRAGPTLWGLFGRKAGSVEGYRYSASLRDSGIVWTEDTVSRLFEVGPDTLTPGSKMPMQRIDDARQRADLIAYLRQATGP
ncbi:c-type cytochrome [Azospirillum sp.]|uniref:c-type cytochrome n=1 Tax=Azospirillum sp. TaxID=34012 RepID=UPI003D705799